MNKNNVVSNAVWIIGCKLIKAILTLVVTMIVAREIGPANYGIINYASSLAAFASPLMKLGLDSIMVHEIIIHPKKEGETLGTAILISSFSSILCIVGIITFAMFTSVGESAKILVCGIYSFILLFEAFELIRFWFHAHLLAKYTAISMLCSYILVAALQIIVAIFLKNLYLIAFILILDYLIISIILVILYCKMSGQGLRFSKKRAFELFSQSKHYIIPAMMVVIFTKTDTVMISFMLGNAATGYYSAAATCAGMTSFVFAAIMDSARPVIFKKLDDKDIPGFENSISMLYSVITYLSLAQCVVQTLFAEIIINIMYGSGYAPAVSALRIVVWFTTFSYYGTVRNIWMLAKNKQKYLWKINLSGAMANVILNLLLIPMWGIEGAAVASLLTQFFTNVIIGFIFKPIRENNILMLNGLKPYNLKQLVFFIKSIIK